MSTPIARGRIGKSGGSIGQIQAGRKSATDFLGAAKTSQGHLAQNEKLASAQARNNSEEQLAMANATAPSRTSSSSFGTRPSRLRSNSERKNASLG
jgi:hypothetical protein